MNKLNLQANTDNEKIILEYLQDAISETFVDRINNGVTVEVDGKQLISKKTLSSFMDYAYEQAKEQAEKGTKYACIQSDIVFGWALHYFEEDSIQGTLYNPDGSLYEPPKPKIEAKPYIPPKPVENPKSNQLSLFDDIEAVSVDQETGEIIEDEDSMLEFIKDMFGDSLEVK